MASPITKSRSGLLSTGICFAIIILFHITTSPSGFAQAQAPKPQTSDSGILPSRYVAPTDLADYIKFVSGSFSIFARETDPFGQSQNPDAKPIIKTPTIHSSAPVNSARVTSFSEVIDRIRINTIMPGEKQFLIGTRSFQMGDRFPIAYNGRSISVEVSAVSSSQIDFKNLQTGEIASVKLNLLPEGMQNGNTDIHAPGMITDQKDAPLEIDSTNPTD